MCAGMGIGQLSQLIGSLKEGMYYMIIESMVPSDLASGLGSIDQAAGASLEQLILDAWIWEIAKEMIREFETSDDAISIETVREALKDGFLTKKHTMTRYRNEFSITRHPEAIWRWDEKEVPRGFSLNKAHEELKRILSKPKAKVVSEDVSKQLDSIVGRVRKNVSS
jgi:trimethylamine:corrinoid methyltransferase-like protein